MPSTLAALNEVTAPDNAPTTGGLGSTGGSTINLDQFVDHFIVDVSNSAIYWQLKQVPDPRQTPREAMWGPVYTQMIPVIGRTIDRPGMCGIRFYAFTPLASLPAGALQAVVTIEAVSA